MSGRSPGRAVLITGATGFLGRALCRHFGGRGWTVRGLVRDPDAAPPLLPGLLLFKGLLPEGVDPRAFEGVDVVVHAAYATRQLPRDQAERINYDGTITVYELSRRYGVGRFVFISSTGAHACAESFYGRSKFELEQRLDPSRDAIIRPGLIIGPEPGGTFHRMAEQVRRLGVVPIFDGGRQIVQTVYINDVCRAIELVVEKGLPGTHVVAEPEGVAMRDLFAKIAARLNRRCRFIPLPMEGTLAMLRALERWRIPLPLTSENLLGLKAMVHMPASRDLTTLGLSFRTVDESLTLCFPP